MKAKQLYIRSCHFSQKHATLTRQSKSYIDVENQNNISLRSSFSIVFFLLPGLVC